MELTDAKRGPDAAMVKQRPAFDLEPSSCGCFEVISPKINLPRRELHEARFDFNTINAGPAQIDKSYALIRYYRQLGRHPRFPRLLLGSEDCDPHWNYLNGYVNTVISPNLDDLLAFQAFIFSFFSVNLTAFYTALTCS
jgi:hypothetical protein